MTPVNINCGERQQILTVLGVGINEVIPFITVSALGSYIACIYYLNQLCYLVSC